MSEATNRMDLNAFSQAVDLNPNQAMAEVHELARTGFLRKVGSGYGVTEKGKNALKVFSPVSNDAGFNFYVDVGKPLGFTAASLEEFYRLLRQVCSDSIEFHLYRGDFERWLGEVVKDKELADAFSKLKTAELHGEDLRKAVLKTVETKYAMAELL